MDHYENSNSMEENNHQEARAYGVCAKDEIIRDLEAKLAAANEKANAAYQEGAEAGIGKYLATEYKSRKFKIYKEVWDPYSNQDHEGEIELSEGVYMGGDLYIVPMQVYATNNPSLLKVVFLVAEGCNSLLHWMAIDESDVAQITENNIRTALMTRDRQLYYCSGSSDCKGVFDLTPPPQE